MLFPVLALAGIAQAASPQVSNAVSASLPAISAGISRLRQTNIAPISPQILGDYVEPLAVAVERNSYVVRDGTKLTLNGQQWTASGANVYWLGLDENVIPPAGQPFYEPFNASYPTHGRITEAMLTLQTLGARTIRSQTIGVSVGNPLSVMPKLGQYNEEAFDTIDWAVYQARQHGIRIMAPLIDNYDYYHGGKFNFLRFRGIDIPNTSDSSKVDPRAQKFYTDRTIINDFKNYIKHLITHKNKYSGLTYAEDPTIFAYETGNELGGPTFGDMDVPKAWTNEIAKYIKQLAPHKLVVDGTYGVNKTNLDIPAVDILSDHYYPPDSSKLQKDIDAVAAVGKVYLAGEYDWTANNPQATPLSEFFKLIESRQSMKNPVVAGDHFWSLFGHSVPNCNQYVNHTDGYTLQYGNPANTNQNNTQISLIRQHLYKMQGVTVGSYLPAVPCPADMLPQYLAEYTYL
ncbi:MAG: hypothetical protein M4579_002111 [Chaenotheca gracillima]|nr:MAG: hypothetical protein M4579_002111 [Chaenotheca gracillima]